ncbi:hypothetical protein PACTADRAFT_47886 [Pachysolen tannophilus NRRL Y-2460]|uniref:Zn(2)-C6 fungal-type domain-containing protein n=1 Tax=Pachysolen tannophilus NRRL Y-2460 TaxID=669874 RepID=A0A1E4U233_PACTA|nr:hypothetical protein PACTADRAFT_47886 [Pachysolen tannophilus NRRL Y-2460]
MEEIKKKRHYSRNGCGECKRRKLKCDEVHPICTYCQNTKRNCNYDKIIKFNNSRIFTINSKNEKLVNLKCHGGKAKKIGVGNGKQVKQLVNRASFSDSVVPTSPSTSYTVNDSTTGVDTATAATTAATPTIKNASSPVPTLRFLLNENETGENYNLNADYYGRNSSDNKNDINKGQYGYDINQAQQHQNDNHSNNNNNNNNNNSNSNNFYPALFDELFNDASSLINDLNDLIQLDPPFKELYQQENNTNSNAIFDNNVFGDYSVDATDNNENNFHSNKNNSISDKNNTISQEFDYLEKLNNSISQNDLINIANFFQFSLSSSHMNYLKIFITDMYLTLAPFATSYLQNSLIHTMLIQAKKAPYLLSAMLATAARYQYYQRLSAIDDLDNGPAIGAFEVHKKLRSYYLTNCLNALDSVLKKKEEITNNIESLLFTILVLAADFSSSSGSNWRAHLRGAKDLLLKYSTCTSLNNTGVALSKCIFGSMEILASLTIPIGGTIHNSLELNQLLNLTDPDYGKVLSEIGFSVNCYSLKNDGTVVVKTNSYNIYLGLTNSMVEAFKETILALEAIRRALSKKEGTKTDNLSEKEKFSKMVDYVNGEPQLHVNEILKIMRLLDESGQDFVITKDAPYVIPSESPHHPENLIKSMKSQDLQKNQFNDKRFMGVPLSCYFYSEINKNWFSYFDLVNQVHRLAGTLRILICNEAFNLSCDSKIAQHLVKRILDSFFFIRVKDNISQEDLKELDCYYNTLDDKEKDIIDSCLRKKKQFKNSTNTSENNGMKDTHADTHTQMQLHPREEENDHNDNLKITKSKSVDKELNDNDRSQIKQFIKKPIDFSKYLITEFDHRLIMLQWVLLISGIFAFEPMDRLIIECCFNQLIRYGIGSAEISLKKVKKNWLLYGRSDKSNNSLFWDDGDSVPFT